MNWDPTLLADPGLLWWQYLVVWVVGFPLLAGTFVFFAGMAPSTIDLTLTIFGYRSRRGTGKPWWRLIIDLPLMVICVYFQIAVMFYVFLDSMLLLVPAVLSPRR